MEYPTRGREGLFNYEQARNSLEVGLVRAGKYGEQLVQIPHQKMEDMTLVYRIHLGESGAYALVTNQLLEIYGITPEQLHRDALRNASVARPFTIREMDAILSQLAEFPTCSMEVDSRL